MIITAQVQQAVKDQLFDLVRKGEAALFGLDSSALDRDYDFAKLRLVLSFKRLGLVGERKHVGHMILAAKLAIELSDGCVADEYDGRGLFA